ncbi:tetratricopeptide repeat protein [Longispora sp. NPDC051575]|uniref:tetratricopeptide repeat protein n=1 Tax=Longispora sp. NPDC051575 TaxID=3154943 RepID=UPI00344A51BA
MYEAARPGPVAVVEPVLGPDAGLGEVFVGRDAHVTDLVSRLDPAGPLSGATVLSAVAGLGGVGKTALARHAAAVAVGRGWFTGGAVMADLLGYDPGGRVEADAVFAPMLRALGVPAADMPATIGEQVAVYHQLLTARATAGQPVLLVLDNVSSSTQVAQLLPRHRAHRVLITSRHTLGDLPGVAIFPLNVLKDDACVQLLYEVLRSRDTTDRRIVTAPDAALRLAELCGRLPLALRITAAILADDPDLTVTALAADLSAPTRLKDLVYGDRSVAAVLDLSLRHLTTRDEQAARLLRLLTLNPGPDIATETVVAMADESATAVRRHLRALRNANLIEPSGAGRWRMHDLTRLHTSTARVRAADQTAAHERLTAYYLTTADAADDHLRALPGQAVPDRFAGRADALAWLDAEHPNLIATTTHAATNGDHHTAANLPAILTEFLSWRRHLTELATLAELAVTASSALHDRPGEAMALNNLGLALRQVRRFEEAITACEQAALIYREIGDRHSESTALNNLGNALQDVRRFEAAIGAQEQAAALYRETGDRLGEGMALNNVGNALRLVRRFEKSITACEQAALIYREIGDRHGEGSALNNLGLALHSVRRFEESITTCEQAALIYRETGDRHGEGTALNNLGLALQGVGRFEESITACQQAAVVHRESGDRHSEGMALNNLGNTLQKVGRFEEAIAAQEGDLAICREIGDRHGEGMALNNLGNTLHTVSRFEEAIAACEQARMVLRETGDRHGEGTALNNLGNALHKVSRFEEAIAAYEQAALIDQEAGDRHGEATALFNLGIVYQSVDRTDEARRCWVGAVEAFEESGDRVNTEMVRGSLADLEDVGP